MSEDIRLWVAPPVRISACWDPIQTLHKRMAALANATFMYIGCQTPPGCCHRPRVTGINDYLLIQMSGKSLQSNISVCKTAVHEAVRCDWE